MTLLIVSLYVGFAITLVSIWWLTTRLREHEDLLLDLYLMLSEVHESLTPLSTNTQLDVPVETYTPDQITDLLNQLGKEPDHGHDR